MTAEAETERLERIEAEYRMTLAALAVVCERLLAKGFATAVVIGDQALNDRPDMVAWRDDAARAIVITVSR